MEEDDPYSYGIPSQSEKSTADASTPLFPDNPEGSYEYLSTKFYEKYKDRAQFNIKLKYPNLEICNIRFNPGVDTQEFDSNSQLILKIIIQTKDTMCIWDKIQEEYEIMYNLSKKTNIVRPYHSEFTKGRSRFGYVMEKWGTSLDHAPALHTPKFIRNYLAQITAIMCCLEAEKVYYGDLKPSNILVLNGVLKLADFGTAHKFVGGEATTNFQQGVSGSKFQDIVHFATQEYLPPEIKNVIPPFYFNKIDVYAMGLVFAMFFGAFGGYELNTLIAKCTAKEQEKLFDYNIFLAGIQEKFIRKLDLIPAQGMPCANKLKAIIWGCLDESPEQRPSFRILHEIMCKFDEWSLAEIESHLRPISISPPLSPSSPHAHSTPSKLFFSFNRIEDPHPRYKCGICHGLVINPQKCKNCRKGMNDVDYFCHSCINAWMENNTHCPFGCSVLSLESHLSFDTKEKFAAIKIKCIYCTEGCSKSMTYTKILEHQKKCKLQKKCNSLANHHLKKANELTNVDYELAKVKFMKAMRLKLKFIPEMDKDIADIYFKLGKVMMHQSQSVQAILHLRKCHLIRTHIFGDKSKAVGMVCNQLGLAYFKRGDYTSALQFLQEAYAIYLSEPVQNVESILSALSHIGLAYHGKGEYKAAMEQFERCMDIQMQEIHKVEENAPQRKSTKNSPKITHQSGGSGSTQNPSGIFRCTSSPQLNSTKGRTTNNIMGSPLNKFGYKDDHSKTEMLPEESKTPQIFSMASFSSAEDLLQGLTNLPFLDSLRGHPAELLWLAKMANTYINMGSTLEKLNEPTQALAYYYNALNLEKRAFPRTEYTLKMATIFNNIGLVKGNMEKYEDAIHFYEKCLQIDLIFKNPGVTTTYNNIAHIYTEMKNYPKAIEHLNNAVHKLKHLFGESHADVGVTLANMGTVYEKMSRIPSALQKYKEAKDIWDLSLGKGNGKSQGIKKKMGVLLSRGVRGVVGGGGGDGGGYKGDKYDYIQGEIVDSSNIKEEENRKGGRGWDGDEFKI